jgi:hypothetical protein
MVTGALVATGAATAVGAHKQHVAARRAETRQKGLIAEESRRQKEQESLIASQEERTSKAVGARLKALAGRRAGRRSLIFDPAQEEASATELASQSTLG